MGGGLGHDSLAFTAWFGQFVADDPVQKHIAAGVENEIERQCSQPGHPPNQYAQRSSPRDGVGSKDRTKTLPEIHLDHNLLKAVVNASLQYHCLSLPCA